MRPRRRAPNTTASLLLVAAACAAPPTIRGGDPLPGADLPAWLARISQLDDLPDTRHDLDRCACAAALSAYLLLGGDFAAAARQLGIGEEFTVANVHRAQEALFRRADRDGPENGILGKTVPEFDAAGNVTGWHGHADDEFESVLRDLGLSREPMFGSTATTLAQRRTAVDPVLAADPRAVFVVGGHRAAGTGGVEPAADDRPANHYVLVFARGGRLWLLDSLFPPGESGLRELRRGEVGPLLYENRVPPYRMRQRLPSGAAAWHAGS